MLSSLLRTIPKRTSFEPEPEDYFQASLGLIFTDDLQNTHGDADTFVRYRSNGYGDLDISVADPQAASERSKFAHHLWNAGVLMGELVGGRRKQGQNPPADDDDDWGRRKFLDGALWWLSEEEEKMWNVQGETVIELGAGAGLGGIMSALAGAKEVAITDYPAESILNTLRTNVSKAVPENVRGAVVVAGHKWGDVASPFAASHRGRFTHVLAADTLWLASEHDALVCSMLHFLAPHPAARIHVIAGFHTGRAKLAAFFEDAVPNAGLEIERIFEMDADGRRRPWQPGAPDEPVGERKKWLVVASLRRGPAMNGNER
ncbi:uncharacterized protein PV09_02793 [Verruconis gallopava]|uniref:Nicotinamide N-methyltransferase n=1 Tax=Verruconis gallopava TaxID=253628 RepID=A0A0D2AID6_9PEZI|nr:uncharacterized protein PV09_02793 [Verruconis gallopava]KIW06330.1 hypothetical protein PV09_02793 [Verruconis gallopava]